MLRTIIYKRILCTFLAAAAITGTGVLSACTGKNNAKEIKNTNTQSSTAQSLPDITAIPDATMTGKIDVTFNSTAAKTYKSNNNKNNSSGNSNNSSDESNDSKTYKKYDYSDVSSNGTVSDSYFKDAVFMGNSILLGLKEYTNIKGTFYARVSLNVNTAFTKNFVSQGGSTRSAVDAIKHNNSFTKVYLMFGTNELGWYYPSEFIKKYEKIIDATKHKNPEAVIYVMSILPVTAAHSAKNSEENNKNIAKFNKLIRDMAQKRDAVYLDVGAALSDSKGCLPESASFDGVHIGPKLCKKWQEYLKTHAKTADKKQPPKTTAANSTANKTTKPGKTTASSNDEMLLPDLLPTLSEDADNSK